MHPGWVATPGVSESLPAFEKATRRLLRDARMGEDTAVWLGAGAATGSYNGRFLFDRAPHPTEVLPGTAVSESQRRQIIDWTVRVTGIPL